MKIIDAHHHIWDLGTLYYPWLTDAVRPRPWGEYGSIRKNYLITDFLSDAASLPPGLSLVKSVHMNAGHDPRHPLLETRWLQSVSDNSDLSRGFPNAIVAELDFRERNVEAQLEEHCSHRNIRGVRQNLGNFFTEPQHYVDMTKDSSWWENLRHLEKFNLSLDVQAYWQQAGLVREIATRNPRTQIMLCHTGMVADQSAGGLDSWRKEMRKLAELPNVSMKISGFSMWDRQWTAQTIRPLVLDAIDIFGPDKSLFATNFPVDSIGATYAKVWVAYDVITKDFSEQERRKLFHDNAERLYRI